MTYPEEIELELATPCRSCEGTKMYPAHSNIAPQDYLYRGYQWCCHCGGSGLRRTVPDDGHYYPVETISNPAPYLTAPLSLTDDV